MPLSGAKELDGKKGRGDHDLFLMKPGGGCPWACVACHLSVVM